MPEYKRAYLANFNVTFGTDEKPLLDYFDTIVYPAFTEGIIRPRHKEGHIEEYFFENVNLIEFKPNKFALVGFFVHTKILKIDSVYEKNYGLKNTHQRYPSAPFSVFVIFLENHRCVLVKNQSESPDVRSFENTVKYVFKEYICKFNKTKDKDQKVPFPCVNIVHLPSESSIKERLREIKKISKLTFKFYPLNGDISLIPDCLTTLRDQLPELESSTGTLSFSSPKNINAVGNMLEKSEGTCNPILQVKYPTGASGTLTSESFSKNLQLNVTIHTGDIVKDSKNIIESVKDLEELQRVSLENRNIFQRNFLKIKKLLSNKK